MRRAESISLDSGAVRQLKAILETARAWMDMAKQAVHSGKLTLVDLQALIDKARFIPVELTQVRDLEETKVIAEAWLSRAADASRLSFSTLSTLVRDGEAINYIIPGLPDMKRMLHQAGIWIEEAFAVFHISRNVPRKQMLSAIQSRAPRTSPSGKRKRDVSGADSSNKPSVPVVEELLVSAAKNRVVLLEVAAVDRMLKEARSWGAEAAKLLGTLGDDESEINDPRREAHVDESEAVLKLISRGNDLPVRADELCALQRIAWFHRKRRVATGLLTLDDIGALLDDADCLHIPDESTLELRELSASGLMWQAESNAALAHLVTLEKLEELVQRADHMKTVMPEALQLKSRVASVKAWVQKAKAAIDGAVHMNELADLVHEAMSLPVAMGGTLKASLKSIDKKVRSGKSFSERMRRKLRKCTIEGCAEAVGVPPLAFTGSLAPPKDRISKASKKGKPQKAADSYCTCMQDRGGIRKTACNFSSVV